MSVRSTSATLLRCRNGRCTSVHSLHSAAAELRTAAEKMASAVDLPMVAHDMALLTGPDVLVAFERYVTAEDDLSRLLDARHEDNEQMLAAFRAESL
jgi:succinylglutamate desuccinylase